MAKKSVISKVLSGLQSKLSGTKQIPEVKKPLPEIPALKLVFFIVDWNKAKTITDVLVEEKVRFHFISRGICTANNEILNLLGIGAGDKAVITCLEQAVLAKILMKEARKKFGFHSPGQGIAFTISLSAINDPVLYVFKQSIHKNEKIAADMELNSQGDIRSGDKGENMAESFRENTEGNTVLYDLVIAIVNQGYSDELMNTARKAGASGGTVISARGQAHEGAVKFFGISVQDEKEIIYILASRENKISIMQAISEIHGLNSQAHGIVFSLPVDNVMGLNFD